MPTFGINRDYLKKKNRGLILKLVATGEATSRIELSAKTGLTKTAISQIVNSLISSGYLKEAEKCISGEPGRNPIRLAISPAAPLFIGVLIQRGYAEAVLCDMTMRILRHERRDYDWYTGEEVLASVCEMIDLMLEGQQNVAGIGIASIGSVDVKAGRIVRPLYFNDIRDVEITEPVQARYGIPVVFDHDNQSAALVERLFGNGRDSNDILLIGIGNGVGCGIIAEDKRYRSSTGLAPEIGHVSIDYRGNKCICGSKGCLETYLATPFVLKRLREETGHAGWDYCTFMEHAGEEDVDRVMHDVIMKFASGLLSSLNLLNLNLIILGIDASMWPDQYIQLLEQEVNARAFAMNERQISIRKPYFNELTHIMGAACNAINGVFMGELL